MAATPSTMLPLGTLLPPFTLEDVVNGQPVESDKLPGTRGVLVMFVCNHCPYVIHVRSEVVKAAHEALSQEVSVIAINSNSVQTHPQDGPSAMKALSNQEGWRFPFLFDSTQEVAKKFRAACTPDFFLFDASRKLVYRGQFDDSRPGNPTPVTGRDLRGALAAMLAGKAIPTEQRASIGCNIKWHPGEEPNYPPVQ